MIIFLLMNLCVGICTFTLVHKIFRFEKLVDTMLAISILYFSQIIITELMLGILGLLYLNNLLLLNLTILLVVWLLLRKSKGYLDFKQCRFGIEEILRSRIAIFLISTIIAFSAVKIFINLINPPFGWDSLNYHFTFAVEWLKQGNLNTPIVPFDDPSPTYYPINGSLLYLWLILPLKSVYLADLGQVPFFILSFLAVYGIARKINLSRMYSFFSGAIFLLIPNFFKQLRIAYVDVMVAALFLACVSFIFFLEKDFSWKNCLIFSLGLGLFLGTKTVALPYSILLLIPFLWLWIRKSRATIMLLLPVLSVLLLGSFSYIRNFLDTGNPLYPLDVIFFGKRIFKGVIDSVTYRAHFIKEDYSFTKALFHEGLGLQAILFILPAAILAPVYCLIKRKGFYFIMFSFMPIALYLIFRFIIPLGNLRYLYALMGIGMVLAFYLAQEFKAPKKVIFGLIIICVLGSMSELGKRQELVISIISTFALFLIWIFSSRIITKKAASRMVLIFVSAVVFILIPLLEPWYIKNEFGRYLKMVKYSGFWPEATKAWDWLNLHTTGNNIAYAGRPVPFPLYGTKFKNNIYYVSVNAVDPVKLHYFADSRYRWGYDYESKHRSFEQENNYRGNANYEMWLKNLLVRKTDYLFIYSLHQIKGIEFPLEDKWASLYPDKFNNVFSNEIIHIYRILK